MSRNTNPRTGRNSNTAIGFRSERAVGRAYVARGGEVEYSPGSRGPYDMLVDQPRGALLAIQVKGTEDRSRSTLRISAREERELKKAARALGARPVFEARFADGSRVTTYLDTGRSFRR